MRRTALRRSTKRMRRTPLRKVSKKHEKELAKYYRLRDQFLRENETCEVCLDLKSKRHTLTIYRSQDLHHRKGRGKYLNYKRYFCAVCRYHHTYIHDHPEWARANGWLISKFK